MARQGITIHKHLTAWREARPVAAAAAPELPQALTAAMWRPWRQIAILIGQDGSLIYGHSDDK